MIIQAFIFICTKAFKLFGWTSALSKMPYKCFGAQFQPPGGVYNFLNLDYVFSCFLQKIRCNLSH